MHAPCSHGPLRRGRAVVVAVTPCASLPVIGSRPPSHHCNLPNFPTAFLSIDPFLEVLHACGVGFDEAESLKLLGGHESADSPSVSMDVHKFLAHYRQLTKTRAPALMSTYSLNSTGLAKHMTPEALQELSERRTSVTPRTSTCARMPSTWTYSHR